MRSLVNIAGLGLLVALDAGLSSDGQVTVLQLNADIFFRIAGQFYVQQIFPSFSRISVHNQLEFLGSSAFSLLPVKEGIIEKFIK